MPSKTFMNLNEEKKNKLIMAAMKEFSTVEFPDVSINQIIMNAEIPRGSFYMYFDDKEDLFEFIIEINSKKFNKILLDILSNNKGDLKACFINLYDELTIRIRKQELVFFKNVFFFFNLRREKFVYPVHILFDLVEDRIDISNIKKENLEFIFTLFMHNLFTSIAFALKKDDYEKARIDYLKHLDIICYGIYKEGK